MLWLFILLVLCGIGMLCYMAFIEPKQWITRHVEYKGALTKELRVLQFSDTHFKTPLSKQHMEQLVALINQEHVDYLLFTGDLMDNYEKSKELDALLPPYLKQMQASIAKLAIYGNHDIGGGALRIYRSMMEAGGFQVLCNDIYEDPWNGIAFFGIDDPRAGYEDLEFIKQRLQPMQVLLSHEPDLIARLDHTEMELMLSGHTHGGQIYLPILSRFILPKGGKQYRKGRYEKANTTIYVSSGIGMTWMPLRFRNVPELIVYHIKPNNGDVED